MKHAHEHKHSPSEKKALHIRLRKIAGQVHSIEKMLEEDADCTDILIQVISVRKALKSFAEVVIHQHVHECIEKTTDPHDGK